MKICSVKNLAVALATVCILGACGGGSGDQGELSSHQSNSDRSDSSESDGTHSGSVQPNGPAAGSDTVGDDGTQSGEEGDVEAGGIVFGTDGLLPLPKEDSAAPVIALIESLLGPTDDLSASVNQLHPFPQVPNLPGSHVMELLATPGTLTAQTAGSVGLTTSVTIKVDLTQADAAEAYRTGLPPLGWTLDSEHEDADSAFGPKTSLHFKAKEGDGSQTFRVEVQNNENLGVTTVALGFIALDFPDPDNALRERFLGWHGGAPVPDGGEIGGVTVGVTFGPGRSDLVFTSSYRYDEPFSSDSQEVGNVLVAGAEVAGVDFERVNDYIRLPHDDFERLDVSGSHITATVRGSVKVITPPFDGVEVAADEKSTENLPVKNASADQIQQVVSDVYGPTADVSSQMQRLGPFPTIPTPDSADITFLGASVEARRNGDQADRATTWVTMFINGDFEDVVSFYEAQLAGIGWTISDSKTRTEDDGLTMIRTDEYEIPESEDAIRPFFRLEVIDDVDDARTEATLSYSQDLSSSEDLMQRWTGWYGNAPLPDGGQIVSAGVSTNGPFVLKNAVYYHVAVEYPDRNKIDIAKAIQESDFSLADDEDPTNLMGEISGLQHPGFTGASIFPNPSGSSRVHITVSAARPLQQ